MRRLFLGLLILGLFTCNAYADVFTVDSLVSADDVTLGWLNGFKNTVIGAINSFPGENLQNGTVSADALMDNANPEVRWGEAFTEFVYTGLLPPTSANLTSITTTGTAYIIDDTSHRMVRVAKDATSNVYTASQDTYVDLSVAGTYTYQEVALGAAEPSTTTNSIRLAKVVTSGTAITSVTDKRVLGVQLETDEDFYKSGLGLLYHSTTAFSVDTGVVYNGATRIAKTTATNIGLNTAGDYVTGASENAASKAIYVYVNPTGVFKLDDTAPDYHDTDGNTAGVKNYYKSGTTYYKLIGIVSTDASSQVNQTNLTSVELGGKVVQVLNKQTHSPIDCTSTVIPVDNSIPLISEGTEILSLTHIPTDTKNKVKIEAHTTGTVDGAQSLVMALFKKGQTTALAAQAAANGSAGIEYYTNCDLVFFLTEDAAVNTYSIRVGPSGGSNGYVNAYPGPVQKIGGAEISSITITEYTP